MTLLCSASFGGRASGGRTHRRRRGTQQGVHAALHSRNLWGLGRAGQPVLGLGTRSNQNPLQNPATAAATSPRRLKVHAPIAVEHRSPQQDLHLLAAASRRFGFVPKCFRRRCAIGPDSLTHLHYFDLLPSARAGTSLTPLRYRFPDVGTMQPTVQSAGTRRIDRSTTPKGAVYWYSVSVRLSASRDNLLAASFSAFL